MSSWTHPAGFTITNTVNAAQQITQMTSSLNDATHPGTLATMTYTPFGALSTLQNGCAGSGCTQTQETYDYNNRLQPVRMQLGTASNPAADYCLVYNYYTVASNPSTCAVPGSPPSGAQNNGNLMGYFYQDATNSSFGRTVGYTYDSLNRLTSGVATGASTYNLPYGYNQDGSGRYGNVTCIINQNTSGYCDTLTFSSATNRITTPGFGYDAAGDMTADNEGNTFVWDAESRATRRENSTLYFAAIP